MFLTFTWQHPKDPEFVERARERGYTGELLYTFPASPDHSSDIAVWQFTRSTTGAGGVRRERTEESTCVGAGVEVGAGMDAGASTRTGDQQSANERQGVVEDELATREKDTNESQATTDAQKRKIASLEVTKSKHRKKQKGHS